MDNGDLAAKIDSLRAELPVLIENAIGKHEANFMHMTHDQFGEMLGGKTPQELIDDHTSLEKGQEFMIAQLKTFGEKQDTILTNQNYIAEVVLGPESTNYDGEIERSGGLQSLMFDMNKKGEIRTHLSTRDRVALYVAGIGGVTVIIAAFIMAFMA